MRGAILLLSMFVSMAALATELDSRLDVLRSDSSLAAFTQASQPREFVFPRDHGPHREFRHEWWYVTGHLDSTTGERFGFELTFFRYALIPTAENKPSDGSSAWRTD